MTNIRNGEDENEPQAGQFSDVSGRRVFLKKIAASAALLPLMISDASADTLESSTILTPGSLLRVVGVSGVRAGVLTNAKGNEPVANVRKQFSTKDAYADPGYWYFYYEANGVAAVARILTSRSSGKQVAFSLVGQRADNRLELISSIGTVVIELSGSGAICRVLAANYRDERTFVRGGGQHSSTYFAAAQILAPLKRNDLDTQARGRINSIIERTARQLNFSARNILYL